MICPSCELISRARRLAKEKPVAGLGTFYISFFLWGKKFAQEKMPSLDRLIGLARQRSEREEGREGGREGRRVARSPVACLWFFKPCLELKDRLVF